VRAEDGVIVEIGDETDYQALVTTIDAVLAEGHAIIGIATPQDAGDTSDAPPRTTTSDEEVDLTKVPVVVVTTTELSLRTDRTASIAKVADLLAHPASDIPELAKALGALATPARVVVVQAEPTTSGALINRIVRTFRHAGVARQLFAIKDRSI